MKILHVCRQYRPCLGGVERFVSDLAARLAARGHTVHVATLNRCWRGPRLPDRETVNGIPVHRLPFVGGPLFFFAPGVLPLVADFDLVHVHNTDFFLDALALTRWAHRRPLVVSTHGGFFHTADHAGLKRLYFALLTRRSLRAADVVIPNSAGDERRFAAHARRAVRIDNAIDYPAFAAAPRRPVPGQLITVGRLAPNKNPFALLDAFAAARAAQPGLSLVVVGDGPLRPALHARAAALGLADSVRWAGQVADAQLRAELSAAELFVSAATYEGFGLALLEAMAAGLVPVVNTIEAFREVIVEGGNGFLADYSQPASAAQTILRALALAPDERARLSAQARATASAYDWSQAVPKFEAVYAKVRSQESGVRSQESEIGSQMKFVPCNLCGADSARELYPATLPESHRVTAGSAFNCTSPDYGRHYRIVQCRECGFVYANPRGDPADVLQAYEAVEDPLYMQERDGRALTFRKHLDTLQRIVGAPGGRRLLDVGAYIGVFVGVARAVGWEAEGIEPSVWASNQAQALGIPVSTGTLAASGCPDATFDVITLWDVIEHFDNPRAELDHVFRLLKPGGAVVIHTIDIGSPTARLMGERWPFLMEMHIAFFSRATLRAMLERAGFGYLSDHTQGRYLRLGYLAGRVTAAFGPWLGKPLEALVSALGLNGLPVPINTLDLFTAYARKPV